MELINLYIKPDLMDSSGVSANSIVNAPATEEGFFAFNSQLKKVRIELAAKQGDFKPVGDKQILMGALMVPGIEIPRSENGKDYLVSFTPETIAQIVEKFAARNINTAINQMHDKPVDAVMTQHFIINREMGIMPPLGQDHLPDGTWFGIVKINDKSVWDSFVKTGIYRGFSVEGYFYEEPVITEKEAEFLAQTFATLKQK